MNILIIEDDMDIFEVVSLSLDMRWPDANVQNAPTGELGVQLAKTAEPDVVILDIGLPDIDGFEVCSRIRGFSSVPIVMLTVRDNREDVIKGLELGADDYIVKPFKPEEMLARGNAVLRRIQMTHLRDVEMIFRQGDLIVNFRNGEVHANSEPIRLGPTEYQIFYHLITNAGRVVARQSLTDSIWGEEYREKPYFLTSRISRLKDTLQGYPQTQNLAFQEGEGGYSLTLQSRDQER
ncbi:MAG: response regulator transcription factor [Chloroflexi bacterium]|nr:response regulator transcription factor [Chloroflexota bacterium]